MKKLILIFLFLLPASPVFALTLTVFPDAGNPGATTVDGLVWRAAGGGTWAVVRAGAGTSVDGTSATEDFMSIYTQAPASDDWNVIKRSLFHFDTSSLGSGATISAATLSLNGTSKANNIGGTIAPDLNIFQSTVVSNTTLAAADYLSKNTTAFSTAITYTNWSTTGYNDYVLNASGISNISLTGVSKFSGQNGNYDAAATTPPIDGAGFQNIRMSGSYADTAGTSQDPKLVVTYTGAAAASARKRVIFITY